MQHLFTYGSLMCEDIMFPVSGGQFRHASAILPGFRRFTVKNQQYPGVVPSENHAVEGIVYHNITPRAWSRLDDFEGEMYTRSLVPVRYENGDLDQVFCYVFSPEFAQYITAEEWDFEMFLRHGKKIFQAQYRGFQKIDQG